MDCRTRRSRGVSRTAVLLSARILSHRGAGVKATVRYPREARVFGRRERKEVFEEIKALTVDIAEQLQEYPDAAVETAFRYAAETWMQPNHMILALGSDRSN
jgi:hypothetical protein